MPKNTPWIKDAEVFSRRYLTPREKAVLMVEFPDCYLCNVRLEDGDEVEFDHVIARGLGGTNDVDNFRPAHKACHVEKSKSDMKAIAKAKRLEATRKGTTKRTARKIPSRPFPKRGKT